MKMKPECYVCAMRQALSAARLTGGDEAFQMECLAESARLLSEIPFDATPPEAGERLHRMIRERSGNPDPFREQKKLQNKVVMDLLPWLRETVAAAKDPLEMAVRLSIAGNAVDPGARESFDLELSVMESVDGEGELAEYRAFAERLSRAGSVLVIADNCGELVFDRVLIETMLKGARDEGRRLEVVLAVRIGPIINDATALEAEEVGLADLCRVVSTGLALPGTILERTSDEFRKAFQESDLVISKGQGNWEMLEDCGREVFFLFQAKCPVVTTLLDCREGQPILART
jgi:hypothetical protein